MFIARAFIVLIPAAIAAAVVCLAFILVVGAVNSRAEEEYWEEFWRDTPSTGSRPEAPAEDRPVAMKKAA